MIPQLRHQGAVVNILWGLLFLSALVAALEGWWSLAFVALASLGLAMAPVLLARRLDITLPLPLVVAITVFIVASILLGEVFEFYDRFWWWDIILHASSAIGFGLIGFVLVLMMFEGDRFAAPAWAVSLLSATIAITIGVFWEVFEFVMDQIFGFNMQKSGLLDTMSDLIVNVIGAGVAAWVGYLYLRTHERSFWTWPIDAFVRLNQRFFRKKR